MSNFKDLSPYELWIIVLPFVNDTIPTPIQKMILWVPLARYLIKRIINTYKDNSPVSKSFTDKYSDIL
jgi:hypothetical protein